MITSVTEENELGLKGEGVEVPRIPSIDKALKQYLADESAAESAALRYGESEDKLIEAMHKHGDALRQPDGALIYRCEGRVVSLVTTKKEKLKVD